MALSVAELNAFQKIFDDFRMIAHGEESIIYFDTSLLSSSEKILCDNQKKKAQHLISLAELLNAVIKERKSNGRFNEIKKLYRAFFDITFQKNNLPPDQIPFIAGKASEIPFIAGKASAICIQKYLILLKSFHLFLSHCRQKLIEKTQEDAQRSIIPFSPESRLAITEEVMKTKIGFKLGEFLELIDKHKRRVSVELSTYQNQSGSRKVNSTTDTKHSSVNQKTSALITPLQAAKPKSNLSFEQKQQIIDAQRKKIRSEIGELDNKIQKQERILKRLQHFNKMIQYPPNIRYQVISDIKGLFDPDNVYPDLEAAITDFPSKIQTAIRNYRYSPYSLPKNNNPTPYEFFGGILNDLHSQNIPNYLKNLNDLMKKKLSNERNLLNEENQLVLKQKQQELDLQNQKLQLAREKLRFSNAKKTPKYDFLIAETRKQLRAYRSSTLRSLTDRTSYKNSFELENQLEGLASSRLQASQVGGKTLSPDEHYVHTSLKTLIHYRNLKDTSKAFRFAIDNVLHTFNAAHTNAIQLGAVVKKLEAKIAHYNSKIQRFKDKRRDILKKTALIHSGTTLDDNILKNYGEDFDDAIKDFSPHIKGKFFLNRHLISASSPLSLWNSFYVNCLQEEIKHNEMLIGNNNKKLAVLQERLEIAAVKELAIKTLNRTQREIATSEKTIKELEHTQSTYSQFTKDQTHEKAKSLPALLEKLHPAQPFDEAIKHFSEPVQQKLRANKTIQKPGFFMSFVKKSPHTFFTTCLKDETAHLTTKKQACIAEVSKNKTKLAQLKHDAELMKLKEKVYNYFQRICKETKNLNTSKYIVLLQLRDEIQNSDKLEEVKSKIEFIKLRAQSHAHVDFSFFGLRDKPMSYRVFTAHFDPSDYAPAQDTQPGIAKRNHAYS